MEITKNSVVLTQLGGTGVPAQACYVRPWLGHAAGVVSIAPKASFRLEQNSVPQTADPMTPAVAATPRRDASARSGIRTEGPPV